MDIKTVSERLRQSLPAHAVQTDVPMSEYTTFRIGGPCDLMVLPETEEQAVFAINVLREMEAPFVVVGNGSNILVADAGYRGCVVHMVGGGHTIALDERAGRVYAGAGENMLTVARFCAEHGLAGMECVSGIPGSLGGTVAMNAGAYEKEMKDVVHAVRVLKPNGTVEWVPCAEMGFGYRTSRVQKENWIVLGVALQLFKDDPAAIYERTNDYTRRRRDKQPLQYPSAGSAFKRPQGYFAAKLIDDAGLKGAHEGDAQVSEKHAGFIVNKGHATCRQVKALIKKVQDEVYRQFQVRLEPEIRFLGEDA